jgi:hypothetical protein
MKKVIIAIIVIALVLGGVYYFINSNNIVMAPDQTEVITDGKVATTTVVVDKTKTVITKSVEGRDITAYHFGSGEKEIILVGGIHGAYSWNTSALAFEAMDYLKTNPSSIPANVKVTVIPVLNPDGLNKVAGTSNEEAFALLKNSKVNTVPGRFNANEVDLNRNFACDWKSVGVWQSKNVSGGAMAFSEPESLGMKNYIEMNKPVAVVVYYSAAGGVYSSSCGGAVTSETKDLTNAYAKASTYKASADFDSYETSGDMTNWLAKIKIPAISVLLTDHTNTEWSKNKAGIDAVLKYYAE